MFQIRDTPKSGFYGLMVTSVSGKTKIIWKKIANNFYILRIYVVVVITSSINGTKAPFMPNTMLGVAGTC